MIRPKNQTEDLLLSITKNCETLIDQTHRKAEETLEFKLIKPRETFHFIPPIQVNGDWMISLIDLEVYNSIFVITEENNKFEHYIDNFDEFFSYTELKDEIAEILRISAKTPYHLQHETIAPLIIKTFQELKLEKTSTDGYYILLTNYFGSPFEDFESYLRLVVGLYEDDIQLILKQYNSNFVTYEITPGIYTFKDISEAIYKIAGERGSLKSIYDDVSMKTKLIFDYFSSLRFHKKSVFHTLLGFDPYWDYKPKNGVNSDSGVYISNKILNLNTINKIHLKCDCIDGSVVDGVRQPILYSCVIDKKPGYKIFSEPETNHYKKINKSVLNTITFYLEDDNNKKVNFNGESMIFSLQMIKI